MKLPKKVRSKLVRACDLTPLEPATIHCYCYKCASVFYDSKEHKIWRTDLEQEIKEPCEICKKPGFDYTVQRRRKPLGG